MRHHYSPDLIIENDPSLSDVMQRLHSGYFNEDEPGIFEPLIQSIRNPADNWMTAADFGSYLRAQQSVSHLYQDKDLWAKKSILNTAASAFFSSDRTIRAYADDIWHIT
jgi:starch phosphorylase